MTEWIERMYQFNEGLIFQYSYGLNNFEKIGKGQEDRLRLTILFICFDKIGKL